MHMPQLHSFMLHDLRVTPVSHAHQQCADNLPVADSTRDEHVAPLWW